MLKLILRKKQLNEITQDKLDRINNFGAVDPSFDSIFGKGNNRIILPEELANSSDPDLLDYDVSKLLKLLESLGLTTNLDKRLIKVGNRELRLISFLEDLSKALSENNSPKLLKMVGEENAQKIQRYYPTGFAAVIKKLMKIATESEVFKVIISRHPLDVIRMSDFKDIQSCHSPNKGYFKCAVQESKGHGFVAFIVRKKDLEETLSRQGNMQTDEIFSDSERGNKTPMTPLARVRLRKFEATNEKTGEAIILAAPENRVYGLETLQHHVKGAALAWANKIQKDKIEKILEDPTNYSYQLFSTWTDSQETALLGNLGLPAHKLKPRYSKEEQTGSASGLAIDTESIQGAINGFSEQDESFVEVRVSYVEEDEEGETPAFAYFTEYTFRLLYSKFEREIAQVLMKLAEAGDGLGRSEMKRTYLAGVLLKDHRVDTLVLEEDGIYVSYHPRDYEDLHNASDAMVDLRSQSSDWENLYERIPETLVDAYERLVSEEKAGRPDAHGDDAGLLRARTLNILKLDEEEAQILMELGKSFNLEKTFNFDNHDIELDSVPAIEQTLHLYKKGGRYDDHSAMWTVELLADYFARDIEKTAELFIYPGRPALRFKNFEDSVVEATLSSFEERLEELFSNIRFSSLANGQRYKNYTISILNHRLTIIFSSDPNSFREKELLTKLIEVIQSHSKRLSLELVRLFKQTLKLYAKKLPPPPSSNTEGTTSLNENRNGSRLILRIKSKKHS
jgi:hypothetical protein